MQKLKGAIKRNLVNVPGWRTKRKIVVIESDDWGAIRLPSAGVLSELEKAGIEVRSDHYICNDSLASEKDLTLLFEHLASIKNRDGDSPKITANTIMANPDFERIRQGGFREYHYELFTETLKRYPEHDRSFALWKEGMDAGLFRPQFHGREHLHVNRWLKGLSDKKSKTFKAFEQNLFGICLSSSSEHWKSYLAAWDFDDDRDRDFSLGSIREGLRLFEETFGYKSLTAIAPNYTWNREIEEVLKDSGVHFLQGGSVQRSPEVGKNGNNLIRHFTGQKSDLGQTYLVRNCRFEPSADLKKDWVESCLKEIGTAFRWRKPAIIESHRVNFIGYINPENRDRNLKLFNELLTSILKKWPDVEFMTSDQLGRMITP
jgi:hypothetical protein